MAELRRKDRIRQAFARAAETYDAHSTAQQRVVQALVAGLPDQAVHNVLDLGCGTGHLTRELGRRYPAARLLAVDFCPEMLAAAAAKWTLDPAQVTWHLGDAESLSFAPDARFDLIASSGALQWFDDLPAAVARYANLLAPGGEFHFACFGPRTFLELQQIWHQVLPQAAPLPASGFVSAEQLAAQVTEGHHLQCELEELRFSLLYPNLTALLRHIQATGTSGGSPGSLLTPLRLRRLEAAYLTGYGTIQAEYQVFFCRLRNTAL